MTPWDSGAEQLQLWCDDLLVFIGHMINVDNSLGTTKKSVEHEHHEDFCHLVLQIL